MRTKREQARRAAAAGSAPERDVVPWLRRLGFRAQEARRAAAWCERIPEATLEERVREALSVLAPRRTSNLPRGKLTARRRTGPTPAPALGRVSGGG